MRTDLRVVAPFRPFPPETGHHVELAAFDWMAAIRMMSETAWRACGHCEVKVLTDIDTDLPFPTFKYATLERRLMLWYLEIAACYLESADFDRDTIMLDSDQLVFQDIRPVFPADCDFGVCIRKPPKGAPGLPILNGVQFWSVRAKDRLAAFHRKALQIARGLPEESVIWGADTEALRILLEPLEPGLHVREGLAVALVDATKVIKALSSSMIRRLDTKSQIHPGVPVLDFRNMRKPYMRAVYEETFGVLV